MKKILLIEDDQVVANIYRNKLVIEGYQVEIAPDGQAGLDLVKSYRPDAVILDLMLPKITGVDLMRQIRAEKDFETVPVIVFSNTYLSNLVQEAWKAGATKCLSKANCTPRQVIEVVRSTLGGTTGAKPVTTTTAAATASGGKAGALLSCPPVPPAAGRPESMASHDTDAEFQAELRKAFIDSLPNTLVLLRSLLQNVIKADSETARLQQTHELYRRIHALTGNAGIAGLARIAQMADAIEALLKELYETPKNITPSTLRTVASAIDFLGYLFEHGTLPQRQEVPPASILVVDDEAISRRAITYALEKAKLKSVTVEDGESAYRLLTENSFDLVFLDVDMPGMNGYELCTKLRALPAHKQTPVVFVTSLTNFESRANSMMSGGNDFITKPFLFIELAVKSLVYVLRGDLERRRARA